MRTAAAWVVVGPAAVWAVVRLLGLERGYPLVPLVAFTPYVALLAVGAALVAAALRRRAAAAVGLVAALALAVVVLPRAVDPSRDVATSGRPLRVLSANVLFGRTPAEDLLALARRERADVVSVQELTAELDRELRRVFPHAVTRTGDGAEGTGVYSRFALERRPPPRTAFLTSVADVRLGGGRRARVVAVHATPPVRGKVGRWRDDLRALPAPAGPPTVLAGDFNATLDHRELRRVLDQGYADAAAESGAGLATTWPAGRRIPPEVTIDHVLVSDGVAVERARVLDLPRSDHRAVLAELVLP